MQSIVPSQSLSMSSFDLWKKINEFRTDGGQNKIQHGDFLSRVEDECDDLGVSENFVHPQNKQLVRYYRLNHDQVLLVGMRESKAVRIKVLEWLKTLAEHQTFQVPQTLPEALRLAADLADQVQEQQKLIEHQKPAVEFVERFVESKSAKSLREVAKVLGVKERDFINRLIEEKILFRQSGNILPYSHYQGRNLFTVKTGTANGHAFSQTKFTAEGINWISKRFGLITGGEAV